MSDYVASNIVILKGLEAVRKRPAMYIGSTDETGLHHLVWEIVDNSIDEALGGHANKITVEIYKDNSVSVEDNGRGIPVDIHPQEGKSALEIAATVLHAGGKFDKNTYKVSSGLHGVGLSVVNALSKWCIIQVRRNNKIYQQKYEKGVPQTEVEEIGEANNSGTKVHFLPDPEIFGKATFSFNNISKRLKFNAYLNSGIEFELIDHRNGTQIYKSMFEGGLKSFIDHHNINKIRIHENIFYTKRKLNDTEVEIALQYTDEHGSNEYTFANNILTKEGGTHLTGLRTGLTKVISSFLSKSSNLKEYESKVIGDDVREGLNVAISVKLPDPQFEGQTKNKLNNSDIVGIVRKILEEDLSDFLERHPNDLKKILEKVIVSYKARNAAKVARENIIRKTALELGGLPGKLADCTTKDPEKAELYIVEGESAGGSAKQGRNREFQAIFPLKGKPINIEKYNTDKIMQNEEICSLIKALGCGIKDNLDINKLRYHKIIFMADADVDGSHINTLLLTIFFRYFKQLIENGFVYIAQPPLYKIIFSPTEYLWVKNDEEKNTVLSGYKGKKQPIIQRFKGLGEMNPEQLWETTMNPNTRTLKKITIEDSKEADEIFSILMGEDVQARRKFIEANSSLAIIDI
ncbi:MAG: DNA topoisomerase (ATP-hydrolyzing) subunit B [Candidatus Dojkabacteria bacterium]|nr:DNA topoisomerase (ATP-hydrolyzing) subunit B [Candidatus Dojkabacteria bacterium]